MRKMYLQWFHWAKELKCYEKKKKKLSIKRNKHNQTLSYWEVSYLSHGLIHCKNKPDEILAIIPKPQFHLWKTSRRSNSALKVHKENPSDPLYGCRSDAPPIRQLSQEFLLQCNNFQFPFTWNHFETANLLWESLKSYFFLSKSKLHLGHFFDSLFWGKSVWRRFKRQYWNSGTICGRKGTVLCNTNALQRKRKYLQCHQHKALNLPPN